MGYLSTRLQISIKQKLSGAGVVGPLIKACCLIAAVCFSLITFYALFKLPFLLPPRKRLWSASYAFGFNNGIAVISFAALLGLATCVLIWLGYSREPPIRFPLEMHP